VHKIIKIEIESLCNLHCKYCFVDREKMVSIDVKETIKRLEMLFNLFGPWENYFRIEAIGEILLYPNLIEYLEYKAKHENYLIEVLSNGVLANEVIKRDSNLKWIFSLDGHTVEMNSQRSLLKNQINDILKATLNLNADLQCVFFKQNIEEINSFILLLNDQNFQGFLHIFPCRFSNSLNIFLDHTKLVKVSFIPDEEYFRRWKFVYQKNQRNFICNFFKYGFTFRITPHEVKKVKCDCFGGSFVFEDSFDPKKKYDPLCCGTCINHFEYNSISRRNEKSSPVFFVS
jgi:MoaA/NifB/PqqE/SkfB family radical SAM enzyme